MQKLNLKKNTKMKYRLTMTGRKPKSVELMTMVKKKRRKMVLPRTKSHQSHQHLMLMNSWLPGT